MKHIVQEFISFCTSYKDCVGQALVLGVIQTLSVEIIRVIWGKNEKISILIETLGYSTSSINFEFELVVLNWYLMCFQDHELVGRAGMQIFIHCEVDLQRNLKYKVGHLKIHSEIQSATLMWSSKTMWLNEEKHGYEWPRSLLMTFFVSIDIHVGYNHHYKIENIQFLQILLAVSHIFKQN